MPRLAICSRDLHWQWINWAPLYDTMEVSMLRLTWLTVAQHVFQPALTGRLELISRKIVSCEPGTKAIAVSRFREKLSPANWVQGVTAISRKISRSWAPKNGVQHATAIYPIPRYTRPRYIRLTLYLQFGESGRQIPRPKLLKYCFQQSCQLSGKVVAGLDCTASKTKAKLDPQAHFPRWWPPDLHADAGWEAHQ